MKATSNAGGPSRGRSPVDDGRARVVANEDVERMEVAVTDDGLDVEVRTCHQHLVDAVREGAIVSVLDAVAMLGDEVVDVDGPLTP